MTNTEHFEADLTAFLISATDARPGVDVSVHLKAFLEMCEKDRWPEREQEQVEAERLVVRSVFAAIEERDCAR